MIRNVNIEIAINQIIAVIATLSAIAVLPGSAIAQRAGVVRLVPIVVEREPPVDGRDEFDTTIAERLKRFYTHVDFARYSFSQIGIQLECAEPISVASFPLKSEGVQVRYEAGSASGTEGEKILEAILREPGIRGKLDADKAVPVFLFNHIRTTTYWYWLPLEHWIHGHVPYPVQGRDDPIGIMLNCAPAERYYSIKQHQTGKASKVYGDSTLAHELVHFLAYGSNIAGGLATHSTDPADLIVDGGKMKHQLLLKNYQNAAPMGSYGKVRNLKLKGGSSGLIDRMFESDFVTEQNARGKASVSLQMSQGFDYVLDVIPPGFLKKYGAENLGMTSAGFSVTVEGKTDEVPILLARPTQSTNFKTSKLRFWSAAFNVAEDAGIDSAKKERERGYLPEVEVETKLPIAIEMWWSAVLPLQKQKQIPNGMTSILKMSLQGLNQDNLPLREGKPGAPKPRSREEAVCTVTVEGDIWPLPEVLRQDSRNTFEIQAKLKGSADSENVEVEATMEAKEGSQELVVKIPCQEIPAASTLSLEFDVTLIVFLKEPPIKYSEQNE